MFKPELLRGFDKEVAEWVSDRCSNVHHGFDPNVRAIGVMLNSEIIAGFVYSDFQENFGTIEMSLAADSPKWATRRIIHELLKYPFIGCGCQRITITTGEDNVKALRLATGIGFVEEAVVKRAYGRYNNAVLLRLFKEDWEAGKYGKRN